MRTKIIDKSLRDVDLLLKAAEKTEEILAHTEKALKLYGQMKVALRTEALKHYRWVAPLWVGSSRLKTFQPEEMTILEGNCPDSEFGGHVVPRQHVRDFGRVGKAGGVCAICERRLWKREGKYLTTKEYSAWKKAREERKY
jgi:hypothetical protein